MKKINTTWFLGIDLGTGSCKSSIVNHQGQLLGFGNSDYLFNTNIQVWNDQDPDAILTGMINAVQKAIQNAGVDPQACGGFSIGCALHGILAVDHHGNPLTPVYTWTDDRAAPQAEIIRDSNTFQSLYQQTGCPSHGMYPLYKIIWLRENQPESFHQTARFISVKEYIIAKLTNKYIVDYSVASGTGLLNIHSLEWNPLSLELAHIKPGQLSEVCSPRTTLAIQNQALANQMNIPSGTPLIVGSSDAANSNIGAGAVHPWQATCMVGTSGAYRIISPKPILSPDTSSWCYCIDEHHWLVGGAINNGGIALSWLRDTLNSAFLQVSRDQLSFDNILSLAEQSEIGGDGIICLPYFAGERSPNWNSNARALFFGMTLHHDIRHISRALLEGIAFRLRQLDEILCELSDDIREVRASGGFTHSEFWIQMFANVLNRPLSVPVEGETSGIGAAYWALFGSGEFSSFEELGELIQIAKTYTPQTKEAAIYHRIYQLFKELYTVTSPLFIKITKLQTELNSDV